MGVSLLGPLTIEPANGALGPRDRVVLAALAVHAGEVVTRDALADALWRDDPPATWNKVVQGCVMRLRRALGAEAIATVPGGYSLRLPPDDIDARRFERLVGRARELLTRGEPERAAYVLEQALSLWRGRPLPELESWEPGSIEATRLAELRLDAEELRLDAALAAGRHREVVAEARARVERAPTRERRWTQLATAQYRAGRQGDALRTLKEARALLVRELGVDPGSELLALERAILAQDPSLAVPSPLGEASALCPWPGLVPYDVDDAELFFGREDDLSACLRRLTTAGVLAVVGPSGSGKSSLVRAGVAAALRRDGRRVDVVTPGGRRPLDVLSSIPEGSSSTVLVVDQCEQVVTQGADLEEQRAFFAALVAHAERAPLVLSVRADRIGELAVHDSFARLVERGLYILGAMGEAEVRSAVEGPARHAGLLLEPGLVDLIVRDVVDEPGALPLMSHALRQTWMRREGPTLTVVGYRETGGIRGAVAQTAERVYEEVDSAQRSRLRDLLLRLVAPGDSGEPVRARVPRDAIAVDAEYEELVERLVHARLVTSDDGVVEIAHEALARAWPRLREWLEEDEAGVRALRHLTNAVAGWDALGRPDSELYRGVRLAQAVEWRDRANPELTAVERAFLERSLEQEERSVRRAEEQVRQERRTVRRLRRLAAAVTAFALATGMVSLVAVDQRGRADEEARIAEARRVAARSLVEQPPDRALLLAVEAVRRWDSPETRGNVLTTIERSPLAAGVIRTDARPVELAVSPDGRRALVADVDDALTLYDLDARTVVATRRDDGISWRTPVFSPDGSQIAVSRTPAHCDFFEACPGGVVEILDAGSLARVGTYVGLGAVAAGVAYSPKGTRLAAVPPLTFAEPDGNIVVWDVTRPDAPATRLTLADVGVELRESRDRLPRSWVAISPDGAHIYASGAGPVVMFDLTTGAQVRSFPGLGGLALSGDGATLAVAASETTVALYDTSSGQRRTELIGHDAVVTSADFSPEGTWVATGSNDETVVVWDAATGQRVHLLEGHSGAVSGVAFEANESILYSVAADRSLITWDVARRRGLARRVADASLFTPADGVVLVAPTADRFAVLSEKTHIVELSTGHVAKLQLEEPWEPAWAAFSPDGRRLATIANSGSTKLFDVRQPRPLAKGPGRGSWNWGAIAFNSDGTGIAVADADGRVTELDGETLAPTGRALRVDHEPTGIRATVGDKVAVTWIPQGPAGGTGVTFGDLDTGKVVSEVETTLRFAPRGNFNADGSRYALAGDDGRLLVVDVESGDVVGPRDPVHAGPIAWVVFSPDGQTLVSMGFDGQVVLSDSSTGAPRARLRPGPTNLQAAAAFDPDGHTLLLAYKDGSAITYETDSDVWLEHACRVAGRDLTADEWHDLVGRGRPRPTCPAQR